MVSTGLETYSSRFLIITVEKSFLFKNTVMTPSIETHWSVIFSTEMLPLMGIIFPLLPTYELPYLPF